MMLEIDIPYIHKVRFGIMKVAVIGSRSITAYPLEEVIPPETTEIISGGARGVDALAREYALAHSIPLTEILPDYPRYGRGAPLRRNEEIISHAELVIALWDGKSSGTAHVINQCKKLGKPFRLIAGT